MRLISSFYCSGILAYQNNPPHIRLTVPLQDDIYLLSSTFNHLIDLSDTQNLLTLEPYSLSNKIP